MQLRNEQFVLKTFIKHFTSDKIEIQRYNFANVFVYQAKAFEGLTVSGP